MRYNASKSAVSYTIVRLQEVAGVGTGGAARNLANTIGTTMGPRGRMDPSAAALGHRDTIHKWFGTKGLRMRVEFFGVPRARAGVAELELQADTLGQLMTALEMRFPSLGELIAGDRLRSSFVANLNGDRFVSDPRTRLAEHDCVLILSADAGG